MILWWLTNYWQLTKLLTIDKTIDETIDETFDKTIIIIEQKDQLIKALFICFLKFWYVYRSAIGKISESLFLFSTIFKFSLISLFALFTLFKLSISSLYS